MFGKLIRTATLAAVAAVVVRSVPDIARYLKIRQM
jgi:hypothetical protein